MNILFSLFPLLFIGSWILVTFILSKMGWSNLAGRYRSDGDFTGNNIGMISASINEVNYKGSIILKYNNEGLYFKTLFLFRLFHPPFFIPWKEISEISNKQFLFEKIVVLKIADPVVATIKISQSTYSKFEDAYLMHNLGKS
jgi:hypothetical protein